MKVLRTRPPWRAIALAVAIALTATVAACGDSGDDDNASAGAQSGTTQADARSAGGPTASGSDEEQVKQTFFRMRDAMYAGDAKGACDEMTDKARAQFAAIGNDAATCEQRVQRLLPGLRQSEDPRFRVISVKVDGDRAIVTTAKTPGQPHPKAPFAKVDGEWKIDGGWAAND